MKKILLFSAILFCFNSFSQLDKWLIMNGDIQCYAQIPNNPDVVFAGAAYGIIRKSNDGGANWKYNSRPSQLGIRNISFLNSDTGFATTLEFDIILKTTDAGNTWQRIKLVDKDNTPQSADLGNIVVVDKLTAFFEYNAVGTKIFATRDGGKTYQSEWAPGRIVHVKGDTLLGFGTVPDRFNTPQFTVYKSVDKGLNWSVVKTKPTGVSNVTDLDFYPIGLVKVIDSKNYFITCDAQKTSTKSIFKTTDGGLSFTSMTPPNNNHVLWLDMNTSTEWMAKAKDDKWYKTLNGGTSWTQMIIGGTGANLPAIKLSNGNVLIQFQGRSIATTNYGTTWADQSDDVILYGDPFKTFVPFTDLRVMNDSLVYAAAGCTGLPINNCNGPTMVKSINGGISWKRIPSIGNVFGVMAVDTFIRASLDGPTINLQLSTDGGLTYASKFNTSTSQTGILKIIPIDKKNVVAPAPNVYHIYYSNDGGNTWVTKKLPTITSAPMQFVDFSCPSINAWYGLTDISRVYKSTDQGSSWAEITGPNKNILGIYFRDDMNGFTFGRTTSSTNTIFKTIDGGANWTNLSVNVPTALKFTYFDLMGSRTNNEFYVSGYSSGTAYATDGGTKWQYSPTFLLGGGLEQIHFTDSLTGGALNRSGQFIKYIGTQAALTTVEVQYEARLTILVNQNAMTSFSIYPNPANDILQLDLGTMDLKDASLTISDALGQVVYQSEISSGENKIKINTLPSGLYFATVNENEISVTNKFIKQ